MKGYNKSLKSFIEYIFNKYKRDENVQAFKSIYLYREEEQERKKILKKSMPPVVKSVSITKETAQICSNLISSELYKESLLHQYTHEFVEKLNNAKTELEESLEA